MTRSLFRHGNGDIVCAPHCLAPQSVSSVIGTRGLPPVELKVRRTPRTRDRDLSTLSLRKCAKPSEAQCRRFNSLSCHGCSGNVHITLSNRCVIGHRGTLLLTGSIFFFLHFSRCYPAYIPLSLLFSRFEVNSVSLKCHGRLL